MGGPKISFTFPIRWLKLDKKHLKKNFAKIINKQRGNVTAITHPRLMPSAPISYSVLIKTHAYQPVRVPVKKEDLDEMLNEVMYGAKLITFEKFFVQTNSPTSLPVLEMQIFY